MNKKDIIKGIVVLLCITVLSGYLLAQAYKIAQPKIEEQKRLEEERLNSEIFPEGARFEHETVKDVNFITVYDENGQPAGKIFDIKALGYGGTISVKAGFDNTMKIRSVKISDHTETPGLGSKIDDNSFLDQFRGKEAGSLYLKKDHTAGEIDAVTGATISSRAVTDGIRKIQEMF